jgi:hypothetical protein
MFLADQIVHTEMYKPDFQIGDLVVGLSPEEMEDLQVRLNQFSFNPDRQRSQLTGKVYRVVRLRTDYGYYQAYDFASISNNQIEKDKAGCRFKKL